ncbi:MULTISPECIES: TetR/AcrR family transcriptional regulator [unclassified Caulobacter]|jgi:AcrR family transcriptional regulator|uniref:TetR/AcrR family transcriptional regulator n=1 Tax=unclassified Caulobacter TaxID=2648921 RepID=UPI0007017F53|nr:MULTISPECIES: TetR/AcrR family transcriptional regulator [unclassified Caulobacter]KQV58611.1 TetR family transcriptional regulator [Caulobacter sp. Root342]KQV68880.1 TetR family transcriptional regulator [Caulobacter sp. Root343]
MSKRTPEEILAGPYAPATRAADRIFDTARELFYREGIRAVGVDEIVTRAGVTKPSLYRSYKSKDELVAAVLREVETGFWDRFEAAEALHPEDPKAQMVAYFQGLADRSGGDDYRGCNLSNAVVEYPDRQHAGRQVAQVHKQQLRDRLRAKAVEMGASDPQVVGDAMMLLVEGVFTSSQMFDGDDKPAKAVVGAVKALIAAYCPA